MERAAFIGLLPRWLRWRVYSRIVPQPYASGPETTCQRRVDGSVMSLHRSDWMERFAAISGAYYDATTPAVLRHVLKPGWWMLDVGANVGFTTLLGARLVGPGKVICFEPNEVAAARLRKNIALNRLTNVEFHEFGLGAADGSAALNQEAHHGVSSMRTGAGAEVPIRRGDQFAPPADVPMLVKIDVEGFELEVLKGMPNLLARDNAVFLIEVTDRWLRQAGGSADALFEHFPNHVASVPRLTRVGRLRLDPPDKSREQYDVLFTPRAPR